MGVNDLRSDGILLPNAGYQGTADLDLLAGAGGRLYRGRMRLDCVDPTHSGTFDFTGSQPGCSGLDYDALVLALAQRGITYLPVLINFSATDQPVPPTADGASGAPTRDEFAAFAAAAAARYGPSGSFWATCGCTPHPIQAWEIWNEENNGWWWGGTASADDYATVFAATRAGLRSADPQARAVVGGLTWDPNGQSSFIAPETVIAALTASNANAFDAVAIHPYTDARGQSPEQIAAAAQSFVDLAAQAVRDATGPAPDGSPRQPIWITELGWSDLDTTSDVVAGALRSFLAGLDAGSRATDSVGPVLWYMLRDGASRAGRDDQLGLRVTAADGSDAGPKPAWSAFSEAAARGVDLPLPPALSDAPAYVAPPKPAPAPAPVVTTPPPAVTPPVARVTRVIAVRARSGRRALTVMVTCMQPGALCTGSANLSADLAVESRVGHRSRPHTVGHRHWTARGGRTATLHVVLNAAGRRALRRGGRLRVLVVVSAVSSHGARARVSAAATVRSH